MSLSLSWSLVVARQFESGDDVHGLQLLEQQLAGVRDTQGGNVAGRLTVVTPGKLKQQQQQQLRIRLQASKRTNDCDVLCPGFIIQATVSSLFYTIS